MVDDVGYVDDIPPENMSTTDPKSPSPATS